MTSLPRNSCWPAGHQRLHADAAIAIEQQFADLGVGGDRQVVAHARAGIEVADRGGDPALVGVGDGDREIAVFELGVLVDVELIAGLLEGFGGGLGVLGPQVGEDAADRDTACVAVPGTFEVHVTLHLLEVGQHVVPVPAGGAARRPFVVVARRAAVGELAVDRGAAAQHARLLIFAQRGSVLLRIVVRDDLGGDFQFGPVEARVEIGGAGIAVEDLRRHLAVRGVLAGLADQDFVAAAGRQAVGENGAGGPAADDDIVVGHDGWVSGFRCGTSLRRSSSRRPASPA